MAKNNIIFYRQWWESIRELESDLQSQVYDDLFRFIFENVEPTESISRAVISPMRSTIQNNNAKYERICERNRANGSKGGAPKGNENARKSLIGNNPKQPKTTQWV